MENRCPYCLAPMEPQPLESRFTERQWTLFNAIVDAGPRGISIEDLTEKLPFGRNTATVRTCIYAINKLISPMRLISRKRIYRLVRENNPDEVCGG